MKRHFLLFYLVIIFALAGCAGFTKKGGDITPGILEPQAILKFSDVPVPAGFRSMPLGSYSFESSGVRVGLLKYAGKANIDQVVNFYKEQMPMYNWRLLNVVEYGERMMNFDREQETCIVSLIPKGKKVSISISLGPKAQLPKKSDRPVK